MGSHASSYGDQATEALCRCDHYDAATWGNQEHCIQSREIVGGGEVEGFAHAFASRVWNNVGQNDGVFVYYKPFLRAQDLTVTYPPLHINLMNNVRWMEGKCLKAGRGVAMDWAEFYYQVALEATANYTSLPKLFDIYRRTCTGSTSTNCGGQDVQWSALLSNALAYYGGSSSNPSYARFRTTGINTGVDH
jgi:hypothetical protein